MSDSEKIKTLDELSKIIIQHQQRDEVVVQCHGVFDLLHPGHIRHFKEAKQQGNKLVVTVTSDRYVNKGVGRPVFDENIRMETLSAIECIDYVALNDASDAVELIRCLRPNVYIKGIEYKDHSKDVTDKISQEVKAVEESGGRIHYTDDIVFSSTELISNYFGKLPETIRDYLKTIKSKYTISEIIEYVKSLETLKVLVVGDAIIDEYQYVEPLGKSGKGLHMVAQCKETEIFAGGVFAVANHVANFTSHVTLLTAIGEEDSSLKVVDSCLHPQIKRQFIRLRDRNTLVKKRYVFKDGEHLSKLFETYSGADNLIGQEDTAKLCQFIYDHGADYDLILVSDFGNGFINQEIINILVKAKTFLAINAQINSGNRGYNVVTHYPRADYISLNEPELRLTVHDKYGEIQVLVERVCQMMSSSYVAVTRGVKGLLIFSKENGYENIPALTTHVVDRVGAGDSYLALSALCLAKKLPFEIAGLIGSVAAAIDVQIVGNKGSVDKVALNRYLTTLFKSVAQP